VCQATVQLEVQRKRFLAMVDAPNDRCAPLESFTTEASRVVKDVAEAMAFITSSNMVSLKVYYDRRGWQIRGALAVEDPQLEKLLLSVSQQRLMLQCQHSKHICLLSSRTHPWRNVRHGFRSLLSFMDHHDETCMPMYESGQCPNGKRCPKRHPKCVKRLYVALHTLTHEPFQEVDNGAGAICQCNTFKCGTLLEDFVSTQNAVVSTESQSTMSNVTFILSL